jgi:hypothetical protein
MSPIGKRAFGVTPTTKSREREADRQDSVMQVMLIDSAAFFAYLFAWLILLWSKNHPGEYLKPEYFKNIMKSSSIPLLYGFEIGELNNNSNACTLSRYSPYRTSTSPLIRHGEKVPNENERSTRSITPGRIALIGPHFVSAVGGRVRIQIRMSASDGKETETSRVRNTPSVLR